jgi:Haem-degrading
MLSLGQASSIVDATLNKARELELRPLTIIVLLYPGGHAQVVKREDGAGILRPAIVHAKAWGCLGIGMISRLTKIIPMARYMTIARPCGDIARPGPKTAVETIHGAAPALRRRLGHCADVTPLEHGLIVDVRSEAEERAAIMNDRV